MSEIRITPISQKRIESLLGENRPCGVRVFDKIDSTNSEAKKAFLNGQSEDMIFIAEEQTAGRGRRGKSFYSPSNGGFYFSALIQREIPLSDATLITPAAAVAVCDVLKQKTKKDPKIKWVNDIFIDRKKVCGILTEAVADEDYRKTKAIIIGIGINLTTTDFPIELENIAGAVGENIDRNELAAELYEKLISAVEKLGKREFMDDYRKFSLVLGKKIVFSRNEKNITAFANKIHDDGSLEVRTEDGETIVLKSGEISIKL